MRNEYYYEKQLIASHDELEARDFWLEKLAGEIRKNSFPYDYTGSGKGYNWDKVQLNLHQDLVAKLISASKQSDYALHIILSAGLLLLLAKYTYHYHGSSDMIAGSPIYRQDVEGEFINTLLPLRVQVQDDFTFKDLLLKVRQTVLEAVNHQNYPIELLIRQLDLPLESFSQQDFPLFDTLILSENIHDRKYIRHINLNTIISFSRTGDLITGELEYNTHRFEKNTIRQIADHFTRLLKIALFNSRLKLSEIEALTESDKKQLLEEFNRTEGEYPADKTLHACFSQQVRKTPANIAALAPEPGAAEAENSDLHDISYEKLEESSNQLARLLRKKGVKANTIVPIIVEPSLDMIIGIIAILKAGGAYLPIEPNNPGDRIVYLLNDSGASLVLTHRRVYEIGMKERNGKELEIEPLFIEEQLPVQESPSTTPPDDHPANLAYVIYTSGTTGRPKGVAVQHGNVVNYTYWRINAYNLTETDVTLQLLSYSFDGFGSNFYTALCSGGSLILVSEIKRLDYEYIKNIVKERGVTHMSLVPAMYEALVNCSGENDLENLKSVVLGGERAGSHLVKRSKEKNPNLLHIIEYGPTETTVAATANLGISPQEISIIGTPIANTRAFILDGSLHPQPKGAPGELCIAGAGVARGYLNNPELTAEKFCLRRPGGALFEKTAPPGPPRKNFLLKMIPGKRIDSYMSHMSYVYRTGDLARWLPDGTIEFLGRIDQQVKIKGFRVELGEIEDRLLQHEQIEIAVAITRTVTRDSQPELELVAFYKTEDDNNIPANEIRTFLTRDLPEYMIPSHFLQLEEFPLTVNGKIDRKALAQPEKFEIGTDTTDKPRNEIEKRILEVWQDVLGNKNIGIESGFFAIGGTSIKALTVVAQLGREISINIDHIYQYGTIAEIAKNVSWKKDSLKSRILDIKNSLGVEAPGEVRKESEARRTQMDNDYQAYKQMVETEKLPSLAETRDYRHILLTGPTGHLGVHLIDEILKTTNARLHLLVKANSQEEARESIKQRLQFYFGENYLETHQERFHILHGDIRDEKLGIDDPLYEELAEMVDAVVHTAADVRHYGMYEDFYKVNVAGTEHLLVLAEKKKIKDFHHISTLGVAQGNIEGKSTLLFTEFCHDVGQNIDNVYLKTKLESEKKILLYREKGVDASIYRVGHLVSNSKTGIFQENIEMDAFYAQLKGFITLGMVPNVGQLFLDLSFVDYIATAFVKLMTKKNLENQTYHLNNNKNLTWPEMVPILNKADVDIKLSGVEEFLDYLMECMDKEDPKYVETTSRLLLHAGLFGEMNEGGERKRPTTTRICGDRTLHLLQQLDFDWERPNESHIKKMIRHCRRVGFLK